MTVRFGAGAQEANVFITFDAAERHTKQARAGLHRDLSRPPFRTARQLLAFDEAGVTFRYKDYRRDGADRRRVMTLGADEFIVSGAGLPSVSLTCGS